MEIVFFRKYEEERLQRAEEEKRKKLEMEMKRLKEQQEYELHIEMMRLQQIEEEKRKLEEEKMELARQEESYRRSIHFEEAAKKSESQDSILNEAKDTTIMVAHEKESNEGELNVLPEVKTPKSAFENQDFNVNNKISKLDETHDDDDDVVCDNKKCIEAPELNLQKISTKEVAETIKEDKTIFESTKGNFEEEKKEAEVEKLQMDILKAQLFNEWKKHNLDYMFNKIKEEHLVKYQQNLSKTNANQMARARSARLKEAQSIPENLLLKNSSKANLNEIFYLFFNALTVYSLKTLELCTNLTFLTITDSQISSLDSLHDCANLKYINAQVKLFFILNIKNLILLNF